MKRAWLAVVASSLTATVVVAGCSNHATSATPDPSDAGTACPYTNPIAAARQGAAGASACAACLEVQCASQLAAYVEPAGCGDYIACVCPGGVPTASATAVNACQTEVVESGCVQASTNVEVCEDTACVTPCSGGSSGMVDGGDAAVVSTGGSYVDASLSPTCEGYVQCCERALEDAGPSATIQTDCVESASLLSDPQCQAYIVAYQDAGVVCAPAAP